MRILLMIVLLLAAGLAQAQEFLDKRFGLELEGYGKATAGNPMYLYQQYIVDQIGRDFVWIKHCRLLENKDSYLKYRCTGYDEYEDCPVLAADMQGVRSKCKAVYR